MLPNYAFSEYFKQETSPPLSDLSSLAYILLKWRQKRGKNHSSNKGKLL